MAASSVKNFIFCVHAHQPVGNFGWIYEEAYEKSYRPFFEVLEKYPSVAIVCHLSGSLIDWLENHRPEFLRRLRLLSDRGQVEFIGGGYYEPIYGMIPKKDLEGQIRMMSDKLCDLFGKSPSGAWLTERVWDSALIPTLRKAGVSYTIVDDSHLMKAGVRQPVTGYYRAKQGAASVDVFASMRRLRYLIPFESPERTVDFIRSLKGDPESAVVFADDCEKFGLWPGTYRKTFDEKWLDRFFSLLEKDPGIHCSTFSRAKELSRPKRTVRIPRGSYREMMQWCRGDFGNFIKKYPEIRYVRDRMWQVSRQLRHFSKKNGTAKAAKKAERALYKAQCNCSYWHGVFGGLYLHHLRSAVYSHLIQAERLAKNGSSWCDETGSFARYVLASGVRWRATSRKVDLIVNPAYGGSVEELDDVPSRTNLLCTVQRHREFYHQLLSKPLPLNGRDHALAIHQILGAKHKGLPLHLDYDHYRRVSFLDRFFSKTLDEKELRSLRNHDRGDFVGKAYRVRPKRSAARLELTAAGKVSLGGKRFPVALVKSYALNKDFSLGVSYVLSNKSRERVSFVFGVELNLSVYDPEVSQGFLQSHIRQRTFHDQWTGIRLLLSAERPFDLAAAPLETVSGSEGGMEKTYQGLTVLCQFPVVLEPGGSQRCGLDFRLQTGPETAGRKKLLMKADQGK